MQEVQPAMGASLHRDTDTEIVGRYSTAGFSNQSWIEQVFSPQATTICFLEWLGNLCKKYSSLRRRVYVGTVLMVTVSPQDPAAGRTVFSGVSGVSGDSQENSCGMEGQATPPICLVSN